MFRLLIELHEELYPCLYAFLQKPCLSKGPLAFIGAAPSVAEIETIRLHRMLLAYYRQVLRVNRLLPKHLLWDGSLLSKLLFPPHPDTGVRLLAARCYASHVSMAEFERVGDKGAVMDVAKFVDGSNKKPHYSIRTLARALTFAADIAGPFVLRRALWEGMLMAFTIVLDGGSAETATGLAQAYPCWCPQSSIIACQGTEFSSWAVYRRIHQVWTVSS